MKYFFDTEFIEGKQPIKFLGMTIGWTKPTIDLISIGMVDEAGLEYYAVSKDFNLAHAWNDEWIKENVLFPIYKELVKGDEQHIWPFSRQSMEYVINRYGKTNTMIAYEILGLVHFNNGKGGIDKNNWTGSLEEWCQVVSQKMPTKIPEFYAYYCNYDWVVFCQLFGKMIDLPKGFPMYCRDLKNLMDFKGLDKEWKRKHCPDPAEEHNALADARWNRKLYQLIQLEK